MSGEFGASAGLGSFVRTQADRGRLVVQPRMGFGDVSTMRAGLRAVRMADACTAGTITLDSHTRLGDNAGARRALARGHDLNGYPIVVHGDRTTRGMVAGLAAPDFPVQVRHGSALASSIVAVAVRSGLPATEGGPVSYCLPYSRQPLRTAIADWRRTCATLAAAGDGAHLESFGGCLLGQLCPPSLLVAMSLLECLFFRAHGLRSVSLSYAQQTNLAQDVEALAALRALAAEFLADIEWHVVVYTFMGLFPRTEAGARRLLADSVELAVATGAERLIVKTPVEAHRIPTVEENIRTLEYAARVAERTRSHPADPGTDTETYREARALITAVLESNEDIGEALAVSFERGRLDVPYCLHPDNRNRARSTLDRQGRLCWTAAGDLPLPAGTVRTAMCSRGAAGAGESSADLLRALHHQRDRYDRPLSHTGALVGAGRESAW